MFTIVLIYFLGIPNPPYRILMTDTLPGWDRAATYLPLTVFTAVGITMMFPAGREKFKTRWEVFTSPNHANPLNQGPFHYSTWAKEKKQGTQCDKGVHFMTAYLLYRPLSIFFQYTINGLSRIIPWLEPSPVLTPPAKFMGFAGDFFFGWMEEYVDGFEKDEGFSPYDMIANVSGLAFALLKEKGYFENLYFFATIHRPPPNWKYHFWLSMGSWEFTLYYDMSGLLDKGALKNRKIVRWYERHFAYNPFLKKLRFNGEYEVSVSWQRHTR